MHAETNLRRTAFFVAAMAASNLASGCAIDDGSNGHQPTRPASRHGSVASSSLDEYDPDLDARYSRAATDPACFESVDHLATYLLDRIADGIPEFLSRGNGITKVEASKDDSARRWSLVASLFEAMGDRARADTAMRFAAELAETSETRRFVRAAPGEWLAVSGRIDEAAKHFQLVLHNDPDNSMAEIYLRLIDDPKSFRTSDMTGLTRYMPVGVARQNVGIVLINIGEVDLGLGHIEAAASLDSTEHMRNLRLGMAYMSTGRLVEADFHLANVLALAPEDPVAHWLMAGLCVNLDRTDEAAERAMEAVRLGYRPRNALDFVMLTFAYAEKGQPVEAFAFLIEAARLGQDIDDSMIVTGALAASSVLPQEPERLDDVLELIGSALWLYPASARLRLLMAARMVEAGRMQAALEEVMLAGIIEPGLVSRELIAAMSRGTDVNEAARRAHERFDLIRDGIKRTSTARSDFQ